jgi:hypothetical protein
MKQPEYIEGAEATRNFEEGMTTLFKVPKDAVVRAEKKQEGKGLFPALRVYANHQFPTRTRAGFGPTPWASFPTPLPASNRPN